MTEKTPVLTPEKFLWEQELPSQEEETKQVLEAMNPQQKAAVLHDQGPLLIIAGAGTGKTKVITHRIAYLISSGKAKPDEILALTFTDKAAQEMEERVDVLLPYGTNTVWISTFHSFGDRILREHAFTLGLPDDFQVLSQPEQIVFLREHFFDLPLRYFRTLADPTRYLTTLSRFFSRLKDEDIPPKDYLAYVAQSEEAFGKKRFERPEDRDAAQEELIKHKELAHCYQITQDLMQKGGKLDFGDQIILALKLLREHPLVLRDLQGRFRYILLDEFQDTNYAQFELVKLMALGHENITVVGDDDQSIFKFRGAAISNILNFEKTYKHAKRLVLTDNYRSTQRILDAAYNLITHNNPDRLEVKDAIIKKLESQRPQDGKKVTFELFDTVNTEADSVAQKIRSHLQAGVPAMEMAVLVRSNKEADPFLKALTMEGIPWRFTGNAGLYGREEIQMLLSFLRCLANPLDSISLFHLASSAIYRFPMDELSLCHAVVQKTNQALLEVFKQHEKFPELKDLPLSTRRLIREVVDDREKFLELSRRLSPGKVLYQFLVDKGFLKALMQEGTLPSEEKVQNLARFFKVVEKFEAAGKLDRITPFVHHLDQLQEAGDDPPATEADPDDSAVSVLTLHKAKGLEFSVVFMVCLSQNRFPITRRWDPLEIPEALIKDILPSGDFHLQEERRLFYVGMTRAKDELVLTASRDYGGRRLYKPSVFVQEALGAPQGILKARKATALTTIERQSGSRGIQPKKNEVQKKIIQLSAKQVEDYLSCPLKYKYAHLLKVPRRWNHAIVYGLALHKAAEEYYARRLKGHPVSLQELLKVFKEAWQSEGFESLEHEEQRFQAGLKALAKFCQHAESTEQLPAHVEKEFKFSLEDDIRMIGRFDRVDIDQGAVTILDYKSSEVGDQKKADQKIRESLQMAVYAMAWKAAQGQYPNRLALYFFDSGLLGVLEPADSHVNKAKEKILKVAASIRQGRFAADPAYMACNYCSYNHICPNADVIRV